MYSRSATLITVSSVLGTLAAVTVVYRFIVRAKSRIGLGLEDAFIVTGLVLTLGICICNILGAARYRFGNHEIVNDSGKLKGWPQTWELLAYGKIFYAIELLHCTAMPLIKGSLILYLRRLFGPSEAIRRASVVIGIYIFLWWFVTFFMTIFQCWPISSNWGTTPTQMGDCIPNYHLWYAVNAVLNVVSDVAVAILPIPVVLGLNMSTQRKVQVILFLSVSAVVIVAGLGRSVSYFTVDRHSTDFTYRDYYYLLWTSIEPCLGVVGTCIVAAGRLSSITNHFQGVDIRKVFFYSSVRSSKQTKPADSVELSQYSKRATAQQVVETSTIDTDSKR